MSAQPTVLRVEDWNRKWSDGKAGWHKSQYHEYMDKYFFRCWGQNDAKPLTFVPLCGKSKDMEWLASKGCSVVGVEANEAAVREFFTENSFPVEEESVGPFKLFSTPDGKIRIFVGDFFEITSDIVGKDVDMIWDRGSFVAINVDEREKYLNILTSITKPGSSILLAAVDFDGSKYGGPPHNLSRATIDGLFGQLEASWSVEMLEEKEALGENARTWGCDWFLERAFRITRD